jgi:hypothetical protein
MTKRNLSVMGNTLVNAFKFTANATMAMLFVALTSCSGEMANFHATAASNLLGSIEENDGLGWAEIDVEASATDINGNSISATANVRYECAPEVPVANEEELGLPVVLTLNADGTIATGDGNKITRSESHDTSKGVTLNVAGPDLSKGGHLGERIESGNTIRQEVIANPSDEAFATAANLPESFTKEWRGEKVSTVKYYRVYTKAAPVEISYRKTFTLDFEDTKGSIYADMLVEKVQGESVLDKWSHYDVMAAWGEYKPQVTAQSVTSTSFTTHDVAGEAKELEADVPGLGDKGTYTRKNVRHTAETFEVQFPSTADAEGNTIRPVRGQIDVWVYTYTFENPEDKHTENFSVEVEVVSTKSDVDTKTNTYERVIEVRINGEVVDTQTGKVSLTIG